MLITAFSLQAQDSTSVKDTTAAKKEFRKINQIAYKTGE
jgi:hypothetical protein